MALRNEEGCQQLGRVLHREACGEGFPGRVFLPSGFLHKETSARVVVHGDDFTFSGPHLELVTLRNWIESWCEIKFRGIMGSGREDTKEIEILGRKLRRTHSGLEFGSQSESSAQTVK